MSYRYVLEVLAEDRRPLERVAVTPDWAPALEWVHFEGVREGRIPATTRAGAAEVEPIWDGRRGQPYVAAFRAVVRPQGGGEVSREIPTRYLRDVARQASARLVQTGVLRPGDTYRYAISAFAAPAADGPGAGGFSVEEVAQPLSLHEADLDVFLERSVFAGPDDPSGSDDTAVPVFVPQAVLDEATALARETPDVETGGLLVGSLHRDCGPRRATSPEVFVEVTAQLPATHTVTHATRLTFTAQTWAAARAAIALRRRDELMVGWWHFHPDFCRLRDCPLERRRRCTASSPFLSAEDVHLHATCFPSGHHVALLISDSAAAGGIGWSLFGWSRGMVTPRGFHVVAARPAVEGGDPSHGTSTTG